MNFLRRFVPNFAETTKHIVDMMKGNSNFRWNEAGKQAFQDIKTAIAHAPVLGHPNYKRDFIIYCYASEHTLSDILMQENDEGTQAPIAFMSIPLKNHELKYSEIEKHAFAIVKDLKNFRFCILHSHSVILVPDTVVKSVLTQQDIGCNVRGTWIAKIQEYDIEMKPTKLIRGNALCRAIAENRISEESEESVEKQLVLAVGLYDSWFENISYLLTYGECPKGLNAKQRRDLKLKAVKYVIWDGKLFKRAIDGTFLRCVDK